MPSNADETKLKHQYSPADLRAIWEFCKRNFETLLETLAWLETLPDADVTVQVSAAHSLRKTR